LELNSDFDFEQFHSIVFLLTLWPCIFRLSLSMKRYQLKVLVTS